MTTRELPTYREQAFIYLNQAHDELEKGDLRQASEKGWGAAAQMVKAVAARRGLRHRAHRDLINVVSGLDDPDLIIGFGIAQTLHQNFYEGLLDKNSVSLYLSTVGALIEALQANELG